MIENLREVQQQQMDEKNGYSISCNADYRCQLVFTRPHPFCHALNGTAFEQENLLHQGRWLVVLFYVWSLPDLVGFRSAIKTVAQFGGQIQLAAQPFEGSAYHWHPAIDGIPSSPLYLLFQEGELVEMKTHFLSPEQLTQWLQEFVSQLRSSRAASTCSAHLISNQNQNGSASTCRAVLVALPQNSSSTIILHLLAAGATVCEIATVPNASAIRFFPVRAPDSRACAAIQKLSSQEDVFRYFARSKTSIFAGFLLPHYLTGAPLPSGRALPVPGVRCCRDCLSNLR